MRDGGINDVFRSALPEDSGLQVKEILQSLPLVTNHRTHQQNLDLSRAIRRILARSFRQPYNNENAIANGPLPETLLIESLSELKDRFKGARVVFICPDENVRDVQSLFDEIGLKNDVLGVRDAKGLGKFLSCSFVFPQFALQRGIDSNTNCKYYYFNFVSPLIRLFVFQQSLRT